MINTSFDDIMPVGEAHQIKTVAQIAHIVWYEHYAQILSLDQIDYMLEKYQSEEAIKKQIMKEGYQYFLVQYNGKAVGYFAFTIEKQKMFLSKIYLLKEYRGKRIASDIFSLLDLFAKENELKSIWLTVNKNNQKTIDIYKRKGYRKIKEQVTDIGSGYVMDDYVLEKRL